MAIIVPVTIIVPLSIGILQYKNFPLPLRLFALYLVFNGLGNLLGGMLAYKNINNLPVLHCYTVLEFFILSMYYKHIFGDIRISKIINMLIAVFSVFCILNALFLQGIFAYNSYSRSIETIIILSYTLYYFKRSLDSISVNVNYHSVLLYINAALLIYFGGSFSLFLSESLIQNNLVLNTIIWNTHATLVLIMYILFTIGLLHVKKLR